MGIPRSGHAGRAEADSGPAIPCSEIIVGGRPILTGVRARILRDEWDGISLTNAILTSYAIGIHITLEVAA